MYSLRCQHKGRVKVACSPTCTHNFGLFPHLHHGFILIFEACNQQRNMNQFKDWTSHQCSYCISLPLSTHHTHHL